MKSKQPLPHFSLPTKEFATEELPARFAAAFRTIHGAMYSAIDACKRVLVSDPVRRGTEPDARQRAVLAQMHRVKDSRSEYHAALQSIAIDVQRAFEEMHIPALPPALGQTGTSGHDLAVKVAETVIQVMYSAQTEILMRSRRQADWSDHWNTMRASLARHEPVDGAAIAELMWREAVRASTETTDWVPAKQAMKALQVRYHNISRLVAKGRLEGRKLAKGQKPVGVPARTKMLIK